MRRCHDWIAVQRDLDDGLDATACRRRFNIRYGAWSMAKRRGKIRFGAGDADGRKGYDWKAVQQYYDRGNSLMACIRRFGFCRAAWHKAVRRREIVPRALGRTLIELLRVNRSRSNLKRRLLRAGLLESRCQECGLIRWLGEPLTIQIDHINGDRNDNRVENLRMLCPNCHAQTETYGKGNRSSCRACKIVIGERGIIAAIPG